MGKKIKNDRCPLQNECERKCEYIGTELKCDYYRNNGIGDSTIPDQEELRQQIEKLKESEAYEAELVNLPDEEETVPTNEAKLVYISVDMLEPHPDNPRKDLGDLTELADSIKAKGIMQNLTVVPFKSRTNPNFNGAGRYTVIIGHRRLGAAKLAGLTELPCVITEMTEQEQIATMLLENMQRSDLTVYEQAQGFQMMMDFGDTVESISEKTGFSKSTVRRRLKMAELDQDALKKVSGRQLSLMDFDRLSEIEDIEVRNKVFSSMGTNNFESELLKAINAQKQVKQKQLWIDAFTEMGITEIPESEVFAEKYAHVQSYRFDLNDPSRLSEVIEAGVEYFYGFAYSNWVYIRKTKVITAEEEAEKAERDRVNAERRAKREALEEASNRAFECRKRFIIATSNAAAKKHIKEIISYTISYAWTPNIYGRFDRDLYAETMGVQIPAGSLKYDLVQYETENAPEYALLCYAYALWNDSAANDYYDYQYMHHENIKLNALYSLLKKLGYEMSDEEIALQDGTSDLFVKPEIEDEEFYDDEDFEDDGETVEAELIEDEDSADEDELSVEDTERDDILERLRAEYGGNTDDE